MAELITLPSPEGASPAGTIEAFLAEPDGESRGGVLFFMDAIGLRPQIAAMVDRIASWGFTVLAPNVFHRDGTVADLAPTTDLRDPEARAEFFATSGVGGRIAGLTPDKAATDTQAYVDALTAEVGDLPLATTGYCMGARLAMRAAGQFPDRFVAVGGFHGGGLVTGAPDSPHTTITGSVEYLFGHADNDGSMTPENAAALEAALADAGATYSAAIYPDAPHGFTMADTSSHQETGAERHFTELRALLDRRF